MVMSKKWKEAASLILTVAGPLAQPIGKKPLAALGESASSHAREPPPL
jgi:hypothetical protein